MCTTSAIRQLQKFHKDIVINFRLVTEQKYQQESVDENRRVSTIGKFGV